MSLKSTNSLDAVEIVMVFDEVFGVDLPVDDARQVHTTDETVDWLASHLSNKRPNQQAATLLERLAQSRQSPELAEDLNGFWRREQILAIVREILQS